MIINKAWAMPNSRTFLIKPIKEFVERYINSCVGGGVIVNAFANEAKYGTMTNDLNPAFDTDFHLDALEFFKIFDDNSVDMVIYDPPYSLRQAAECYNSYGKQRHETSITNMRYWADCKDNIARILKPNGICLCFGWNTNGIGKNRGFEMQEILIVAHGGSKNDTLCTAERKKGV